MNEEDRKVLLTFSQMRSRVRGNEIDFGGTGKGGGDVDGIIILKK